MRKLSLMIGVAAGALALGGLSRGVTTLEMAAGYASFANNGIYTKPRTYVEVRDHNGNTVTTQLNEQMLVDIAQAGGGIYVRAANINAGIDEIVKQLERLEKENYGSSIFSEYESRFQYPLAAALLCLLAEVLIAEKRNKKYNLGKLLKR